MPGTDTAGEDSGLGLVREDNCTEAVRGDRQGQGVVRERHKAWVVLLHGCKAAVHFDRGGYQTDQQQELSRQDHRQQKPEQKQPATRPDGTSIAD